MGKMCMHGKIENCCHICHLPIEVYESQRGHEAYKMLKEIHEVIIGKPCPSCVSLRAIVDRIEEEGIKDELKVALPMDVDDVCLEEIARALVRYLKEGK